MSTYANVQCRRMNDMRRSNAALYSLPLRLLPRQKVSCPVKLRPRRESI